MHPIRLAAMLSLVAGLAQAQPATGLSVQTVWSRAALAGRVGVLYLTVTDTGAPDRLLGISTPVAGKAELHESRDDHGVMTMRAVDALPVAPGKPLTLAPGGYHAMLVGLTHALKPGDTFPVTLTFEHAGAITATATVQKAGASTPASGHKAMPKGIPKGMPGMDMPGMD